MPSGKGLLERAQSRMSENSLGMNGSRVLASPILKRRLQQQPQIIHLSCLRSQLLLSRRKIQRLSLRSASLRCCFRFLSKISIEFVPTLSNPFTLCKLKVQAFWMVDCPSKTWEEVVTAWLQKKCRICSTAKPHLSQAPPLASGTGCCPAGV